MVLGTRLAVRLSTKLVVASGLLAMTVFYTWVTTASRTTGYGTIAGQMVVLGTGMGLTSAPATEAIMGVVPKAQAGVGSAVNNATRLLGGTLGVAVIGSVYASLYAGGLTRSLPAGLPAPAARIAHGSVGAAFGIAHELHRVGQTTLAAGVHNAATSAFFHGLRTANIVAAGVCAVGTIMALTPLPGQPAAARSGGTDDASLAPARAMATTD